MAKDLIVYDFESFYDSKIKLGFKHQTTQQYLDDPRFEVIGVGVKLNAEPTQWFSGTHDELRIWFQQFPWGNAIAVAHNAMFDASILTWHFGIKPFLHADTLAMGAALHGTSVGGSLRALGDHYGVGEKGHEVVLAEGKRRVDFSEEELARYGAYCINDVDMTHALFTRMAPMFNKTEMRLIDMTVRMHSEPAFELDVAVLEDHLHTIRGQKALLLMASSADQKTLMSNEKLAEFLRSQGVQPPVKMSKTTGKLTYAFAKTDEPFKELLEHPSIEVQAAVAARLGVKSTLEETRTERFIDIANAGGALPVPLKYYGAVTGRWAASDKTNLQNIPRGSRLKEAIRAPEGFMVVGSDLSNIELRMGLYFANQMDKLKLLSEGVDLYKDFASSVFGVPYDEVNDDQRFIGKTSQLSLIYGVGAAKLRAAIFAGSRKDIGEYMAKNIVELYRHEYSYVAQSWAEGTLALEHIREDYYYTFGLNKSLQLPVHGDNGIELPSGLFMRFPDMRQSYNDYGKLEWTYAQHKKRVAIHGAKCFQNTIQALARCIMGEAMVRIHKTYPVALTIHDAVYCVVPEEQAEKALRDIIIEMRCPPTWAPGIVLDAEGGYGKNLSFKMKKVAV